MNTPTLTLRLIQLSTLVLSMTIHGMENSTQLAINYGKLTNEKTIHKLRRALAYNDTKQVQNLLDCRHLHPNIKLNGYPIFFYAKSIEIAQVFINHKKLKVNLQATDNWQTNILWHVVRENYPSAFVKLYLKHGADPRNLAPNGDSLLHEVARSPWIEHATRIELLKAIPYLINMANDKGKTPLDIARKKERMSEIITSIAEKNLIVENDETVSEDDSEKKLDSEEKDAALKKAAAKEFEKIIILFRNHGACTGQELGYFMQKNDSDECICCI